MAAEVAVAHDQRERVAAEDAEPDGGMERGGVPAVLELVGKVEAAEQAGAREESRVLPLVVG